MTGAPLRELLPDQCLLIADKPFLKQNIGRLWLDNVYIRIEPSKRTPGTMSALDAADSGGEMWVTRTTIQGDGAVAEVVDEEEQLGLKGLSSPAQVYAHGMFEFEFPAPAHDGL